MIRRGQIRWYRFTQPDRKRPVLILTRDSVIDSLHEVTVAPITTTIREIPTEVALQGGDEMPRDCAVNLDHLQTVPKAKLGALVTSLAPIRLAEVRASLLFALGFED